MKRLVAAVMAVLFFACAPAAVAQTPRHNELGRQFVEALLTDSVFEEMLKQTSGSFSTAFSNNPNIPADWAPLMDEAAREELLAKRQLLMEIMGRGMARHFTEAELEVAAKFFRSPGGRKIMAASLSGQGNPPLTRAEEKELDKLYRSPAGQSFFGKKDALDTAFKSLESEFIRAFVPGLMRRFGEKVEAYEASRRAAA